MQNKTFHPTRWTLVFLLLSSMMILMGGAAVAPALPAISAAFPDASEALISLIITLPALAIVFSGFFIGAAVDKFGKVRILAISLAVFTFAGVSGFFLTSLPAILVGRIILGIGISGIVNTTTTLITDYYQGPSRVKVLGYQAAAMGIGVVILDTSGGFLAGISWRMAFLIYLLGLFILIGTLVTMKEPVREKVNMTRDAPKNKTPVGSIVLIYITLFLGMMLFFLMPTKFPYLIAEYVENSSALSGILLGILGIFSALIGTLYWRIAGRIHRMVNISLSFILLGAGYVLFGLSESMMIIVISVIIIGIGNGLLMPTVLSWLGVITPREIMGKVMGGYGVSLNLGQFLASIVAIPVIMISVGYGQMFFIFGVIAIILGVFYLLGYLKVRNTSHTN
ncbi:MAG: MFS transporter [Methanocorpusculum sp.]|nr:MFS transporter [Methanocorpusculum sp.]